MTMHRYQARLVGLAEASGQIAADRLVQVVQGLMDSSERTLRILATGEGRARGGKPEWLKNSVNFVIAGLRTGSTIIDIDARPLRETAYPELAQGALWKSKPNLDDTPIDLLGKAVAETQEEDSDADHMDSEVLNSIYKFADLLDKQGIHCEISGKKLGNYVIRIDSILKGRVSKLIKGTPIPRRFVVSGFMDEIRYEKRRFILRMESGLKIPGKLERQSEGSELLRNVWGRKATVSGSVHFKPNGEPSFIEASAIDSYREGDEVFALDPSAEEPESAEEAFRRVCRERPLKPMDLFNAIPGDELSNELLADLDF